MENMRYTPPPPPPKKTSATASDIQAAIEAGKALGAAKPFDIEGVPCVMVPCVMVPDGMRLNMLDELMETPRRIEACVDTTTADSFIEYFNAFSRPSSIITCDIDNAAFVGIIDYHSGGLSEWEGADWCRHRVTHTCKTTPEWTEWTKHDGHKMSQVEFALFIERNLDEIVRPEAAKMLEIALTLKANTKLRFESGHRLTDGQVQIEYREELDSTAGAKGDIKIPETFALGIRVFEGSDAFEMEARFRYRIKDGQVAMWYDLVRPHKIHRAAVDDVYNKIKESAQARMILHGSIS